MKIKQVLWFVTETVTVYALKELFYFSLFRWRNASLINVSFCTRETAHRKTCSGYDLSVFRPGSQKNYEQKGGQNSFKNHGRLFKFFKKQRLKVKKIVNQISKLKLWRFLSHLYIINVIRNCTALYILGLSIFPKVLSFIGQPSD